MFILPPGTLRCLWVPPDFNPQKNWVHTLLLQPRSLRSWNEYLDNMYIQPFSQSSIQLPTTTTYAPNMWSERSEAAEMLKDWLNMNARMRWIARKWVQRVRVRICKKRRIGANADIYTTEPVPNGQCVEVVDFGTRSTYVFHTFTAHRMITEDLLFQQYGISDPRIPRNPYINLPWSYGQICSFVDQIQTNLLKRHKFVCQSIQMFRCARYDLTTLLRNNMSYIRLASARNFFRCPTALGWEDIYRDTLDALMEEYMFEYALSAAYYLRLSRCLLTRTLPGDFLSIWDEYVTAYWLYLNYKILLDITGGSIEIFMRNVKVLLSKTAKKMTHQGT